MSIIMKTYNDTRILEGSSLTLFDLGVGGYLTLGRDAFWSATNMSDSQAILLGGHCTVRVAGEVYGSRYGIYSAGEEDYVEVLPTGIVGSMWLSGLRLGAGSEVRNAGEIFGSTGIFFTDGGSVTNSGRISGDSYGISFAAWSDGATSVVNSGTITGEFGVVMSSSLSNTVVNSGTIAGGRYGLAASGEAAAVIHNSGTITGQTAIYTGTAGDTVVNTGAIVGKVELLGGDDVFDSSAGSLIGTVNGGAGDDLLIGSAGGDVSFGDLGDDRLRGGGGDDVLAGGAGADEIDGGEGRDLASYEDATAGVIASLIDPDRNAGDAAGDRFTFVEGLIGSKYADALTGDAAANELVGGEGDDILDGGRGADMLRGGMADDTYFVDHKRDSVVELADQGTDSVHATISYVLPDHVENLELDGVANLSGTGNALNNTLIGNAGRNTLTGGAGEDWLDGGAGADILIGGNDNDTYVVDHRGDRVVEDAEGGIDRVISSIDYKLTESVEHLELTGGAIRGTGNAAANVISGSIADNVLDGGAGSDILIGWGGADRFVFSSALDGEWNVDTIVDWDVGMDKVVLDRSVFGGAGKTLTAGMFAIGTEATEPDDRLIYDAATGDLRWDADGVGGKDAVLFAHVDGAPALQVSDVMLVG